MDRGLSSPVVQKYILSAGLSYCGCLLTFSGGLFGPPDPHELVVEHGVPEVKKLKKFRPKIHISEKSPVIIAR